MKIFITGGTGFIGSNVLMNLVKEDNELIVLARNEKKTEIFNEYKNVKFVIGEIDNYELIYENLKDVDAVIHIALFWGETASEILAKDTTATVKLYEMAIENKVKRFIYTSSTAAVGYVLDSTSEISPISPEDHYGASKAASEMYLRALSHNSNIITTIIRPGYTFGNPIVDGGDMEMDSRFRDIVEKAKNNKDINLIEHDGTQFISANDLAKIYVESLKQKSKFEIYFGLATDFVTWKDIADMTIEISNSSSKIILEDKGWSKTPTLFDVRKIENNFGFKFIGREKIKDHLNYLLLMK